MSWAVLHGYIELSLEEKAEEGRDVFYGPVKLIYKGYSREG